MCFVFIWEQTASCATYSINWLVFITEMKSVYCAVRTEFLNKAVCASSLKGLYTIEVNFQHFEVFFPLNTPIFSWDFMKKQQLFSIKYAYFFRGILWKNNNYFLYNINLLFTVKKTRALCEVGTDLSVTVNKNFIVFKCLIYNENLKLSRRQNSQPRQDVNVFRRFGN